MPNRPSFVRKTPELAERRPDFVDALAKGLQVLAAFERDAALGNTELVAATGLPKATVSRLAGTLVTLGYLQRDEESRKYLIGSRVLGLGARLQRHMRLQRVARPHMQRLADRLDLSVVLGTRDGLRVVLLEVARPPRSRLTVNSDIGSHLPLEGTSIGLGCLVAAPVRERVRLLDRLQRDHAEGWSRLREHIERAHAELARNRFILRPTPSGGPIAGATVPLLLERRRVFAFTAVGPAFELPRVRLLREVGPALADMVDQVAQELGGSVAETSSPARVRRAGPSR